MRDININIGARLGPDFGALLLAASALLVGALLSSAVAVTELVSFIALQKQQGEEAPDEANASHRSADLSQRTESQAANLEETAASVEQLSATVKGGDVVGQMVATLISGISQINQAVAQLDHVTQQNAALVEEAAAAAESLNQQSARMVEVVSVFKLNGSRGSRR